ncbi:hypothetical protein ILYODFUR_025064 [Ilyodon furcidens]|uniref:Ubiquitin-like protease family profile domain-containing protein n=1 Tax=Ilyodon furcidens TaxID=33524 RepID=A0ABV0U8Y6_9TELE
MRWNRLGKADRVNNKWQPGTITHTFQKDGTSCGVFVMEMAKMTVMEFPNIPKNVHVESSKRCIKKLRQDMAEEILKGSGICSAPSVEMGTCSILSLLPFG